LEDRKAAEEFCRRLEYASHESKAGRLIETRARELISEIVEHATGEPLRNFTAEEWLREWLKGKKATKAEATFLKYSNAVKGFLASLGPRAKLNVNQITLRDVHRFQQGEIEAGKYSSTCNDHVKIIRMAFTSARWHVLSSYDAQGIILISLASLRSAQLSPCFQTSASNERAEQAERTSAEQRVNAASENSADATRADTGTSHSCCSYLSRTLSEKSVSCD
jgi:hypothetical protein